LVVGYHYSTALLSLYFARSTVASGDLRQTLMMSLAIGYSDLKLNLYDSDTNFSSKTGTPNEIRCISSLKGLHLPRETNEHCAEQADYALKKLFSERYLSLSHFLKEAWGLFPLP
jgi:hypothetical protein